jgi:hypothetical protein
MNIFYLDSRPVVAAQYHCDKHVCKMIVEYAQLLSTAHHIHGTAVEGMYKKTHSNHPSAIWTRSSPQAYEYVRQLLWHLLEQYAIRYFKVHKTLAVYDLCRTMPAPLAVMDPSPALFVPPPLCMPDQYKTDDAVDSYRKYYVGEKSGFARWKNSAVPGWFC